LSNLLKYWRNPNPTEFRSSAAFLQIQRSNLYPVLRVGGHLPLTDFRPDDQKWTLAYGWRPVDSTINTALGISIIIFTPDPAQAGFELWAGPVRILGQAVGLA